MEHAIQTGKLTLVKIGFNQKPKPSINAIGEWVILAINCGQYCIYKYLIGKDKKLINFMSVHGYTPLAIAVIKEDINIVNDLLLRGARVNITLPCAHFTAAMFASQLSDDTILKALIIARADLSICCVAGRNALIHAIHSGSFNCVLTILKYAPHLVFAPGCNCWQDTTNSCIDHLFMPLQRRIILREISKIATTETLMSLGRVLTRSEISGRSLGNIHMNKANERSKRRIIHTNIIYTYFGIVPRDIVREISALIHPFSTDNKFQSI